MPQETSERSVIAPKSSRAIRIERHGVDAVPATERTRNWWDLFVILAGVVMRAWEFFNRVPKKGDLDMRKHMGLMLALGCLALCTLACAPTTKPSQDIITGVFPEAQAELHAIMEDIQKDAMNADVEPLQAIHLDSPKFSKFGPRNFDRQTVEQTNESEAEFVTSVADLELEWKDIKIDVFGDFAIATYYPHFSFVKDGQKVEGMGRQTLVFLKTEQGWKIIHEHGAPKS